MVRMEGPSSPEATSKQDSGLVRGIVMVVALGAILGVAYNFFGLQGKKPWGLAWIGQDPLAATVDLAALLPEPAAEAYSTADSDPLAIPALQAGQSLPEIPESDRPIQISLGNLRRYFEAGAVLLIDARDPDEYADGHIAGAVNLPLDVAATDLSMLESLSTGGRPVVTYCGGGTCEISLTLAHELIAAGQRRVLVFMGGYPEWVEAGLPVETVPEKGG